MPIETNFAFQHEVAASRLDIVSKQPDRLGLLRPFVGPPPADTKQTAKRRWVGKGFNLIWRPNFGNEFGPKDFFLQLMFTDEQLAFNDVTGKDGIANRSLFDHTLRLGGAGYVQTIQNSFDGTDQHFEAGVWLRVPQTSNPLEPETAVRMGSIPHGTTINLQGRIEKIPQPQFAPASIVPFTIGAKDDGKTGLSTAFATEMDLSKTTASRTDLKEVAALTQDLLANPSKMLQRDAAKHKIVSTTRIMLSSDAPSDIVPVPRPDIGGGVTNIASLLGKGSPPGGGPNASAPHVSVTLWIEELEGGGMQLQYSQRVLINFNRLSWPHISLATLTLV